MMPQEQVLRVIKSLVDLQSQCCSVNRISTDMVPSPEDPDFLDPVVVIAYSRGDQTDQHAVRVYCDGSMSDF